MKIKILAGSIILFMHYSLEAIIVYAPGKQGHKMVQKRPSSNPYIAGDSFREACDFIFDETYIPFNTDLVRPGDSIFVKTDFVGYFFKNVHPHIRNPYILVTHNSDYAVPGVCAHYLDDEKLIAWFGQNSDITHHPKFFPIPIGIANRYWGHGDINEVTNARAKILNKRSVLLYLNFTDSNNKERVVVRDFFEDKSFCTKAPRKNFAEYLEEVTHVKFVLCPTGNGLDCHRQWETLLMGAIPILTHSTLDPLFDGLPVVLINDWSEVTEEFLTATYETMQKQKFAMERMFVPYWIAKIEHVKQEAKKQL